MRPQRPEDQSPPVAVKVEANGFQVRVEASLAVTTKLVTWHFVGAIRNDQNDQVSNLVMEVKFFKDSTLLSTETVELQRGQAPMVQGDTMPLDVRVPMPADADRAVAHIRGDRGPAKPPKTQDVPRLSWNQQKPLKSLVFKERLHEVHWFGDGSRGFCHLTLELTNNEPSHPSRGRLKLVRLKVVFEDVAGAVLEEREVLPVYQGACPILSGERRLAHIIVRVPKSYASYRVTVEEVEST